MVLPHSILGSLEDFRSFLEVRGETEGYHVGSEFWSLPQRYGDEMSGITATLTQTEQGRREPVTHVGQPSSIRQESGITRAEILRPASRTWDQSTYLQHQYQELGEVLRDMDIKKPDINGLEVIGSGKPFTSVTVCHSPLLEREGEEKKENLDPLAQYDDVQSNALLVPALRFCGQLASWTGNSPSNQGEVGISATIIFEALTGERASSHLELHNEGSTAIFFSWQQLPLPHSFPNLRSQTKSQHFYFDSSSGVILPGDTMRVEFIFKSERPGIKTELWQFNTHPMLLQGASMQTKLEKIVRVKMCRSIVYEVLQGIHTPERPSSPAEIHITEEQKFRSRNPKYLDEPVEDLKRLWQEVSPGRSWNLSIDTLRQVVLSLPEEESSQDALTREKSLVQLNCLLLKLPEPLPEHHHLTAAVIGQQLWRKLLDTMAGEAMQLRHLLSLPEKDTWVQKKDEPLISDSDLTDNINKDKSEKRGGASAKEERSGGRSRGNDDNKGESKSVTSEKSAESSKKREKKKKDEMRKRSREKQEKESAPVTDTGPESVSQQPPDDQNVELEVMDIYTRLLHQKVREATSNDPWGPSSSLMSEIADLTFNVVAFAEVMGMVWKRLNDSGKNWRHVYKALTLLDYLLKTGSERVAQQCRENAFTIQTLRDFQYVDRDGRDQGANVREKARQLVYPPSYHPGRRTSQPSMAVLYGEEFSRSRGSPSSFNSSSSSPRAASDLEQARPQTSGEEELQLQLALAMSREESQKLALPPPLP
eukprot:superscaffoldBa00005356_g20237